MTTLADRLPPTQTRVERSTDPEVNAAIRARTDAAVARMEDADIERIDARIRALEREWDVERALQANAGTLALAGALLGAGVDRRFLLLPAAVFAFLAQHALQGWCPPIPVLRRLGFRTMREIDRERLALKALRGDFDEVPAAGTATAQERARQALAAVDA